MTGAPRTASMPDALVATALDGLLADTTTEQLPAIAAATQRLHGDPNPDVGTGSPGLLHQVGIEHGTAHDPERCIPR